MVGAMVEKLERHLATGFPMVLAIADVQVRRRRSALSTQPHTEIF